MTKEPIPDYYFELDDSSSSDSSDSEYTRSDIETENNSSNIESSEYSTDTSSEDSE